jgi:GAF domain-containing protein
LTYLGIPLSYRGESEGTICLFSRTLRELTSQEVALLEAIGRQIVIGLENARLFRETQAALAEVEATHRSYLRRGWQEHLRLREMRDRSGFVCDRVGGGRAEDVRAAADLWRPEMERALMEGGAATAREDEADGGGRHGLAVPISLRGETLGVLGVESSTHARTWSESDIALLQAVSEQLAQTLEMARLFADTQRRAEREQLIAEITTRIRASTGVEDILKTTAEELGRALGTSRTRVRLGVESPSSPPGGVDLEPSEEAQPREYEGE